MIDFLNPLKRRYARTLKKQQAADKLRVLIEKDHWNIYKPLPSLPDIAKLLDQKEKITLAAVSKLIRRGIILQGLNGELYISATGEETYKEINYSGEKTPE